MGPSANVLTDRSCWCASSDALVFGESQVGTFLSLFYDRVTWDNHRDIILSAAMYEPPFLHTRLANDRIRPLDVTVYYYTDSTRLIIEVNASSTPVGPTSYY